ncbi:S41 family peptidase [Kribbella sp. NPDC051952]|uniref:S41 family peptidase n=1 Tax=Kribbella sp. NPDC051952 TaxID=3154851 RepID=UPI003414E310
MRLTRIRPARRLLVAVGIAAGLVAVPLSVPLAATAAASPNGVWQADGYGTLVAIDNGKARLYQTTGISCTPNPAEYTQDGTTFAADGEQSFTFTVRRDRAALHLEGDVGEKRLRRLPKLPALCTKPGATGPLATFDQFWTTFDENYPFFAAKGIDWDAVRAKYRPQVTSDAALFDIFTKMIRPLGDAHTAITTPDRSVTGVRPGTTFPTPDLETNVIRPYIEDTTLRGVHYTSYANDLIGYAQLPGGIGYLRVVGFLGYGDVPHYAPEKEVLDRTLDTILATKPRKLILDLRLNGGGSDQLALDLASRLTARPYFAYAKRNRNDPADPTAFTAPQPAYVVPTSRSKFTGPMAILTGGSQLSAGETFTMAMMNRTPRPIRIGQNTQGVFSDTMNRTLPNGWQFNLPNEEYLTAGGTTYDGAGIPPDLRRPVFTPAELTGHRDSAFTTALRLLKQR